MVRSKLAEKDAERLPSAGLKTRLMQEALFFLGKIQVAQAMLGDVPGDSRSLRKVFAW